MLIDFRRRLMMLALSGFKVLFSPSHIQCLSHNFPPSARPMRHPPPAGTALLRGSGAASQRRGVYHRPAQSQRAP